MTLATLARSASAPPSAADLETRILDAALVLIARWGLTKTAVADIAREAGCARATVYRAFPGGRVELFEALGHRELTRAATTVAAAIDAADDLGAAVAGGLCAAATALRDHDAAQFVVTHEPGLLVPVLGFHHVDLVYQLAVTVFAPRLERFTTPAAAAWAAECAARAFVSLVFTPSPDLDLTDVTHARSVVDRFILPSLVPASAT